MPIHVFSNNLKEINQNLKFKHIKNIVEQNNIILLFSLTECNPCKSLIDMILSYNQFNDRLNVIKFDIEKDINEDDYSNITYVPYIIHIKKEHYVNWENEDNIFNYINDNNKCILYENKREQFIYDNDLNDEF